jgi:3-methyladenine DNA glycosylase Mpg
MRVYMSLLILLNMWDWAYGGSEEPRSGGGQERSSLSPTAHLFRSRGHIYTYAPHATHICIRTACETYSHVSIRFVDMYILFGAVELRMSGDKR